MQHIIEKSKMRPGKLLLMLAVVILLLGGCTAPSATTVPATTHSTTSTSVQVETPSTITTSKTVITTATTAFTPIRGVPATSASAITSPPPSMVGINTHTEVYGTDADPNIITLGPKLGIHPESKIYANKHGMEFELSNRQPVLAPIDMVLVGFSNSSAKYRIQEGTKFAPCNDLTLCFESVSPDWPGMVIKVYHLYSSPLLRGHYQNPDCSECEEWGTSVEVQGHLYADLNDSLIDKGNASACEALIGYTVKRGELIGFAGSVGTHSFVSFCFKVSDTSVNPFVQEGNRYLHWVQPSAFFYWKSYSPNANFPSGVLAYPFECDGYQLPPEQRDVNFKYTERK